MPAQRRATAERLTENSNTLEHTDKQYKYTTIHNYSTKESDRTPCTKYYNKHTKKHHQRKKWKAVNKCCVQRRWNRKWGEYVECQ